MREPEDLSGLRPGAAERSPRRVMTISADMGGGHNATASALEEAVGRLWPGSEIRRLDLLELLGPGFGALFRRIYVSNVERTPWLYEFFYSALWRQRWFATASKAFTGMWSAVPLAAQINRFDPDLILSTYPLASSGLAWLRRHRGLSVPCAAWVSDFAPHPFWVYRDIDLTVVMHEVARPNALAAEPGARVVVSRAPVVKSFRPGDRAEARRELGLRADAFVVLVSCGAYSFGDVPALARALLEVSPVLQLVAMCGRNEETLRRLQALQAPEERLLPLGWSDRMSDYLRAADVVVSNAGGATALEALATLRPVVMCRPIAAHGAANAQLMVVSGLADLCDDEERLVDYLMSALADRQRLQVLECRAAEHAHAPTVESVLTTLASQPQSQSQPSPPGRRRAWPLRPADAFFGLLGSESVRQEIGAVIELDPVAPGRPLDLQSLRRVLAERLPGLPPLRRRLQHVPRLGWVLDQHVDVAEHVREHILARSDGDREADLVVDRFWSTPLPLDRPAWQMLLVHGHDEGRALLAVKMLHAQADGVSALGLLDRLLTAAPDDRLPERGGGAPGRTRGPASTTRRSPGLALRLTRGLWSLATRGRPPRHPLNAGSVGPGRTFVRATLPADALRETARALRARPHELVFSILADALGDVLRRADLLEAPHAVRAMIPVAMRAPRLDRIFGNWTGAAAVDLPLGEMSPQQRLAAVQAELRRRTERGEPDAAQVVMRLAGQLPAWLHARFARLVYTRRFFSLILTYMPGARRSRCCAGAAVRALYPVLPLAEGVPVTAGAVLADGSIGIGILLDSSLGLHRDDVTASVARAFETALTAAHAEAPESEPAA